MTIDDKLRTALGYVPKGIRIIGRDGFYVQVEYHLCDGIRGYAELARV